MQVTQDSYFSLLTHTKQLLLVTFCGTLAGIEVSFGRTEPRTEPRNHGTTEPRNHGTTGGQTDVEVEIVI